MGLLKHFRSRSRLKSRDERQNNGANLFIQQYTGPDRTARLPDNVLRNIFLNVCPHADDGSYEPSETPLEGEGCMLCDLRDLAHCALVRRGWYGLVQGVLYTNIRIDAVHYCELEDVLAEKRRHKKFLDRNGEPPDVPAVRLALLARTLRDSPGLAACVHVLKLPYMTRETCKADVARAAGACPHLRYVDLPEGVSTGDAGCLALRSELAARTPDIRRTRYQRGGEAWFEQLLTGGHWRALEVVELARLRVDAATLRRVLAMLPRLRDLRLDAVPAASDALFRPAPALPDFPALTALAVSDAPRLTAQGLLTYLAQPQPAAALASLTLTDTAVATAGLHQILARAPRLARLGVTAAVSRPLQPLDADPQPPIPPLASHALRALHLELTSASPSSDDDASLGLEPPAASHYAYLATSLAAGALPALRQLYVRDPAFPDQLVLAAPLPAPGFAGFSHAPSSSFSGLAQPLAVYTKGLDELDWVYTAVAPGGGSSSSSGRTASMAQRRGPARPVSFFAADKGLGPQWGGEARRSVIVGNGFGGFLAVPADGEARPRSSGSASVGGREQAGGGNGGGGGGGGGFGHARYGSWAGAGSTTAGAAATGEKGGQRSSFFGFKGHEKKGSRHDLWR